ncbi:MAG TPA: phenylpyruvate tautomerase MIF-related protein [Polyangiaceae bacterium]|nr:phenylpyruvate tautomerase MIF-related protein [Polyangiaceae bacterium]
MPLIQVITSAPAAASAHERGLLRTLSARLAEHLKKPERYVMTCLDTTAHMTFAGSDQPACYVEIKSIGRFTPDMTRALSAEICDLLAKELGVARDRIYIEFSDSQGHLWGHDGDIFA